MCIIDSYIGYCNENTNHKRCTGMYHFQVEKRICSPWLSRSWTLPSGTSINLERCEPGCRSSFSSAFLKTSSLSSGVSFSGDEAVESFRLSCEFSPCPGSSVYEVRVVCDCRHLSSSFNTHPSRNYNASWLSGIVSFARYYSIRRRTQVMNSNVFTSIDRHTSRPKSVAIYQLTQLLAPLYLIITLLFRSVENCHSRFVLIHRK